ncbi:MAG: hypothetical protein A3H61_02015 [Candidatus Jacksonbacteria bacterium RIFCSPLOWO2_02_FULL_44_20]|uniref:CMP/dCMP-type deaminase domain-containing protein n=1 Tax=Candidatus Jacksonbacteria bacterium RIFCSPLOWO2_02_FULL_44_20 TaxID=1798460 RepID=A0A1G2AD40_9BACT|nr:MAG: hypothetical protein A3H61_02015 [Candidatus Jacksonbacteria bacterium RIFCSPLOWO2_02_FULL_44_20]
METLKHNNKYEYAPASHPFMQEARAEAYKSGCGSRQIGAVIVNKETVIARGHNARDRVSSPCPRAIQNIPSGIGYNLCPECIEENHTEADALRNARLAGVDTENGEMYIFGHWWACESCWDKVRSAGITKIYLVKRAREMFQERGVLSGKRWYQAPINLFIFDWSGVISDDRKPVYETTARVLKQFGKIMPVFDEFLKSATMTALEYYRKNDISEDADLLLKLFRKYFNEAVKNGNKPTIYADAPSVFGQLTANDKKIAILSSHPEKFVEREAQEYGIDQYITHIRGGSRNKETDLQNILTHFQTQNKHALYCGDTIHDIRAARAAGIRSAGIGSGYHSKEQLAAENPDFLFDTLLELTSLL